MQCQTYMCYKYEQHSSLEMEYHIISTTLLFGVFHTKCSQIIFMVWVLYLSFISKNTMLLFAAHTIDHKGHFHFASFNVFIHYVATHKQHRRSQSFINAPEINCPVRWFDDSIIMHQICTHFSFVS